MAKIQPNKHVIVANSTTITGLCT